MNPQTTTAAQGAVSAAAAIREELQAMEAAQQAKRGPVLGRLAELLSQVHPSMAGEVRETLLATVERAHGEHLHRLGEINTALEALLHTLNRGAVSGGLSPAAADSGSEDGRRPPGRSPETFRPPPRQGRKLKV